MATIYFTNQNFDQKKNLGTLCTNEVSVMLGDTSSSVTLLENTVPHIIMTR